jgi:hypothetical protein
MRRLRPSAGFCALVIGYAACFAFLGWGLSTPPLDRVWQLHHELKIGRTSALSVADHELLAAALRRHPRLGEALLGAGHIGVISAQRDNWVETAEVTLVRTPQARAEQLSVELPPPPEPRPIEVSLSGAGWQRALPSEGKSELVFDLPPVPPQPELLTLRLLGGASLREPAELGVRVRFDPPDARGSVVGARATDGDAPGRLDDDGPDVELGRDDE